MQQENYQPNPYQYPTAPAPMQQANPSEKILKLVIAIATFVLVVLAAVFTFITVQNMTAGGSKDGKYITIEFDGTKFKLADTYGEIIREIAKQRPIYNWGGVMNNDYKEIKDIDTFLSQTVREAQKTRISNDPVNPVIKTKDGKVPAILISPLKDQEDITKDKTQKIGEAYTRLIVYPLGERVVLTIDGFVLDTEKTTGKEFKEYFGDAAQPQVSKESKSEDTGFYMHYKNRYIYIMFGHGDNNTFSGLEIVDVKLY